VRRIAIAERTGWRALAEELGFDFHTIDGQAYWDESAYYAFDLRQIEHALEAPTEELHQMALALVDEVVASEQLLAQLAIPRAYWDWIAQSWRGPRLHLYGRLDLAYAGQGPAKLYELNYDTPTSLYESAFFQWLWLEQQIARKGLPAGADQFNSLQEKLVVRFTQLAAHLHAPLYFSAVQDSAEDQATVSYLRDCAEQAGLAHAVIAIENIGLSADGRFTDLGDALIGSLFKLYPIEAMLAESFGPHLPGSGLQLIEPPWKIILSNKGVLPLLWERHRGHPNLLEARFCAQPASGDPAAGWVRKPFFSREGANVLLTTPEGKTLRTAGPYGDGPMIEQAWHPTPSFEGRHALIGSWVVGDQAAGIGIREDASPITQNSSRFVPHAIL
jgi:glutathionylspermidine synthase